MATKFVDPLGRADLLLTLVGQPVESDRAREQIRSFLIGELLTRGIRKAEAAAVVERDLFGYRVQLLLRDEDDAVPLKSVRIPLKGFAETALEDAMKKVGITEFDDPTLFVVTRRTYDSRRN